MSKTFGVIGGAIVLVLVGWAIVQTTRKQSQRESGAAPQSLQRVEKVPDLSLEDYTGKTVNLGGFVSTPLVVNAWAAWCPFCKDELPDFAAVQREFKDQVVIIAIDRAESLHVAKKFSDEAGVTDQLVFLLDPSDSFYQAIGGFAMPETLFVDKDGTVKVHKRGPMTRDEIREKVRSILPTPTQTP